jgi:hypothetical protein
MKRPLLPAILLGVFVFASPAFATATLQSGNVNLGCDTYTITFPMTGLTVGMVYSVDYTFILSVSPLIKIAPPVVTNFTPTSSDYTAVFGPYHYVGLDAGGNPLQGSFTPYGVATLLQLPNYQGSSSEPPLNVVNLSFSPTTLNCYSRWHYPPVSIFPGQLLELCVANVPPINPPTLATDVDLAPNPSSLDVTLIVANAVTGAQIVKEITLPPLGSTGYPPNPCLSVPAPSGDPLVVAQVVAACVSASGTCVSGLTTSLQIFSPDAKGNLTHTQVINFAPPDPCAKGCTTPGVPGAPGNFAP